MDKKIVKMLSLLLACVLVVSFCGCEALSSIESTTGTEATNTSSETSIPETTKDTTPEATEEVSTTAPESTEAEEVVTEQPVLNGRGRSDEGRSEPQYKNVIGYVACYKSEECTLDPTWQAPIYQKDKQFFEEIGKVAHKTQVLVLEQELEHSGWGNYTGYLLVKNIETEETFYIDVHYFINTPYWEYDDLFEATVFGDYIAEYNQKSDYYPVNKSGEKVELADGMKVLVTGKTGTMRDVDNDTHPIEALVYKEWQYGYGGVPVFFNAEDLNIVY